jgi:hypothetical protein
VTRLLKSVGRFIVLTSQETGNVSQILRATNCTLINNQVVTADEANDFAVYLHVKTARPGVLKIDCTDGRQEIDPMWRVTELNHRILPHEILFRDVKTAKAKVVEDTKDLLGILLAQPNPSVKVAGVPGQTVGGNRVPSDNEVSNATSVE